MWVDGIDERKLSRAVEYAAEALGVHARTGYLIAPVTVLTTGVAHCRSARISKYLLEVRQRMVDAKTQSYIDAALNLEDLLRLTTRSFAFYQITLLLQRVQDAGPGHSIQMSPQCTGPGMVPMAIAVCTQDSLKQRFAAKRHESEDPIEQAQDEDSDSDEAGDGDGPNKKANVIMKEIDKELSAMAVMSSVPGWSHRVAVQIAQIMLHILQSSDFLKLCCRLAQCDLHMLITYDVIEYCLCEHRRLVSRLKRRSRKPLNVCKFVTSHSAEVAALRRSMVSWLLEKHAHKDR
jgi:hypothetical protein